MLAQYKSQSREKHDGGAHGPKSPPPPPPCIHRESSLKIFHPFCKPQAQLRKPFPSYQVFVSPLAWIRNTGGLVNPRLEKMICCRIEEQPCTAHISYSVCAHLLCMIHVSALLDFPWNATGFFFFSYSPTFSAACNISCCNIYYPTTRPARPACLSFPQSPHHQLLHTCPSFPKLSPGSSSGPTMHFSFVCYH